MAHTFFVCVCACVCLCLFRKLRTAATPRCEDGLWAQCQAPWANWHDSIFSLSWPNIIYEFSTYKIMTNWGETNCSRSGNEFGKITRFKWRACGWSRNLKLHSLCEAETTLHPHTHSHFKSRMSSVHSSSALHKRTTKCARLNSQSPPGTERLAVHTHTHTKKLNKNDYVINVCMLWLRCFRWIRLRVNILLAISYSALAALTMLNTQKKPSAATQIIQAHNKHKNRRRHTPIGDRQLWRAVSLRLAMHYSKNMMRSEYSEYFVCFMCILCWFLLEIIAHLHTHTLTEINTQKNICQTSNDHDEPRNWAEFQWVHARARNLPAIFSYMCPGSHKDASAASV